MSETKNFKYWLIFGPQSSGTNLLESIILKNFTQTNYNHMLEEGKGMWKHTWNWKKAANRKRPKNVNNCLKIVLLKEPVFWFESMNKASYNFSFKSILGEITHKPNRNRGSNQGQKVKFKNGMDVFNTFVNFYKTDNFFKTDTIFIKYWDLLHRPKKVINKLSKFLSLKTGNIVKTINNPAKVHGKCRSREAALAHYTIKNYISLKKKYKSIFEKPKIKLWKDFYRQVRVIKKS